MSQTFLQIVIEKTRAKVARMKNDVDIDDLRRSATQVRSGAEPFRLQKALRRRSAINIIAEVKRASPSKGIINADIDIKELARSYEQGGAAAISVLTEEKYFHGSMDDLRNVRSAVEIPLLRKDFIVDEIQILEAAIAGADAVLLIVAALPTDDLASLLEITRELGMDALVEIHSGDEMVEAARHGPAIIGVNNRNLHSLEVSLEVSRRSIANRPGGALMVAESGISNRDDIDMLHELGFDGFLIGEALMRDEDPRRTLKEWS
jgi:indole-3-glycerol phosphate synthase